MFKIAFSLLFLTPFANARTEHCSLNFAKKFTDAVTAIEIKENKYGKGKRVFKRGESHEFTVEYLNEQIRLLGKDNYASKKYIDMREELEADKDLHIYYLQYTWDADNHLDLGFYYSVRLSNYDSGCTLKNLKTDI